MALSIHERNIAQHKRVRQSRELREIVGHLSNAYTIACNLGEHNLYASQVVRVALDAIRSLAPELFPADVEED